MYFTTSFPLLTVSLSLTLYHVSFISFHHHIHFHFYLALINFATYYSGPHIFSTYSVILCHFPHSRVSSAIRITHSPSFPIVYEIAGSSDQSRPPWSRYDAMPPPLGLRSQPVTGLDQFARPPESCLHPAFALAPALFAHHMRSHLAGRPVPKFAITQSAGHSGPRSATLGPPGSSTSASPSRLSLCAEANYCHVFQAALWYVARLLLRPIS